MSRVAKRTGTLGAAAASLAPAVALAHSGSHPLEVPWTAWNFSPEILAGTLLLGALYVRGLARERHMAGPARAAAFFCGLAAVLLSLASPLDALAERSFFVHQIQHLLLQIAAPLLLLLAAPQRILLSGVPPGLRRGVLARVLTSPSLRRVFGLLVRPWVAAFLLVATQYVWHWPPYHDLALLDDAVHYLMHVTMLAAGLVFFASVLDPRPPPIGAAYGTRWNALLFAMTAGMLLGAALALKETVLYAAYERFARPWGLEATSDERIGGLIMWIPGSILMVPVFLHLLRLWNAREGRLDERRRRGLPVGARAGPGRNLGLALALGAIAIAVLATTFGVALLATGELHGARH
ncbi:MAG: cytochrome c oxidase assembly protein [Dehalococcoidia bacterium]|nr:cytochrome c oxidase assembly protein [Dehalococcoidia bacterium]